MKLLSRCNRFSPLDYIPKLRPFNPHNRVLTPHICVYNRLVGVRNFTDVNAFKGSLTS
jgi:hypothetical protein